MQTVHAVNAGTRRCRGRTEEDTGYSSPIGITSEPRPNENLQWGVAPLTTSPPTKSGLRAAMLAVDVDVNATVRSRNPGAKRPTRAMIAFVASSR